MPRRNRAPYGVVPTPSPIHNTCGSKYLLYRIARIQNSPIQGSYGETHLVRYSYSVYTPIQESYEKTQLVRYSSAAVRPSTNSKSTALSSSLFHLLAISDLLSFTTFALELSSFQIASARTYTCTRSSRESNNDITTGIFYCCHDLSVFSLSTRSEISNTSPTKLQRNAASNRIFGLPSIHHVSLPST